MPDPHFLSATPPATDRPESFGPLRGGERGLWRGRCAVAEYSFGEAASLPRWALPETTDVFVTDQRIGYAYTRAGSGGDLEVTSGELRWLWPQHLRVQPGARTTGRAAAAAQVQLVCAAADGSFPALVFAGGDLATIGDVDRLANLLRHAIAGFRVDHAERLGLSTPQARMLSRLLIGPEFSNFQGGEGQTVTLLGALPVNRPVEPVVEVRPPAPAPAAEPQPRPAVASRTPGYRPGLAADEARAQQAAAAEEATHVTRPDLASRAADLAARVADLVSAAEQTTQPAAGFRPVDLSQEETTDLTARAATVRRAAARFAANSAKGKAGVRRPEREIGSTSRGNRNG